LHTHGYTGMKQFSLLRLFTVSQKEALAISFRIGSLISLMA